MAGFGDILGQENCIAYMKEIAARKEASHAYMISGPASSGKGLLAETFAMALQCEEGRGEPCLRCKSCRQALSGNQPDIRHVVRDPKKTTVSVDNIREQVLNDVCIKPYSSRYKIYIIDEGQLMREQGQNALLKTLEEPPAYAVLLLLTTSADAFLPTIRSRCVQLHTKAVEDRRVKAWLMERYQVPDYQAEVCATFAQGSVGKAILLASSPQFFGLKESTLQLMGRLKSLSVYEWRQELAFLEDERENIEIFLDLLLLLFRDVLLCKATASEERLIFLQQAPLIAGLAADCSYENLQLILQEIQRAQQRIRANVNRNLTLELLLGTIKENIS